MHGPTQKLGAASILRVLPGTQTCYVVLSARVVGVWTHYVEPGRTLPCLSGCCPFDHQTTSMRWQGWIQVAKPGQKRSMYLGLTWSAARDEQRLFQHPEGLRGWQIYVSRSGHSIQSRMHCLMGFRDTGVLPAETDVKEQLLRFWGHPMNWPHSRQISLREWEGWTAEIAWDENPFLNVTHRGEER